MFVMFKHIERVIALEIFLVKIFIDALFIWRIWIMDIFLCYILNEVIGLTSKARVMIVVEIINAIFTMPLANLLRLITLLILKFMMALFNLSCS